MRKIRSKGKAETFEQRMRRHHQEFLDKFTEITGRPPSSKEKLQGYNLYYTDRVGPWEAAAIIAK